MTKPSTSEFNTTLKDIVFHMQREFNRPVRYEEIYNYYSRVHSNRKSTETFSRTLRRMAAKQLVQKIYDGHGRVMYSVGW